MKPPRKAQPLSEEYIIDSDDGISPPASAHQPIGLSSSTHQPSGISKLTKRKRPKETNVSQSHQPMPESDSERSNIAANMLPKSSAPRSLASERNQEPEFEDSSEDSENSVRETVVRSTSKKHPQKVPSLKPVPSRPFKPPRGFKPVENEGVALKSKMCQLISELGPGKQVWHIIAPASVPLSELKELTLDAIQRGEDLAIGSQTYSTTFTASSNRTLLAAMTADGLYRPAKVPISHTLRIRKIPTIEVNGENQRVDQVDPSIFYASEKPPPRPTPKQPPNLNGRYYPIGTPMSRAGMQPRQVETNGEPAADAQVISEEIRPKKKKRDAMRTPKKALASAAESEQLSSPVFIPDTSTQATITPAESPTKKKKKRKRKSEPQGVE